MKQYKIYDESNGLIFSGNKEEFESVNHLLVKSDRVEIEEVKMRSEKC